MEKRRYRKLKDVAMLMRFTDLVTSIAVVMCIAGIVMMIEIMNQFSGSKVK